MLEHYRGTNAMVLAIPRGGVAVGHALAGALGLPMDVLFAKKIGHPGNREFAIGAVSLGSMILDNRADIPREYIEQEVVRIREGIRERMVRYRGNRPLPAIAGRTVILVDDGVATGSTLLATMELVRDQGPARIVVAMPVVPAAFIPKGRAAADEFVCVLEAYDLMSVGQFYRSFEPVEDEEAMRLLQDNWNSVPA